MSVYMEDVIETTGGCGRFQVIVYLCVHFAKVLLCFTMLFMMFGGLVPGWWCVDDVMDITNVSMTLGGTNDSYFMSCDTRNTTGTCARFMFDSSVRTIVSEWNLVCDSRWIISTITSIQMAGLVVGNTLGGHSADAFGRKPTLLGAMLVNTVINIGIIVSPSWVVFAVLRFFLGVACGFQLTVMYSIQCEFAPTQWRSFIFATPSWPLSVMLFAFVCWLVQDWKHVHMVTAGFGVVSVISCLFVRESFRWYVAHDRVNEAFNTIKFVAKINKRPFPDISEMEALAEGARENEKWEAERDRKYSLLDLARSKVILKYTIYLSLIWFSAGLSNYGIQFGVSALSGSFYLNVVIYSSIKIPLLVILHFLQNGIGRRKAFVAYLFVVTVSAAIAAITYRFKETETRNMVSRVCALIAVSFAGSSFTTMQMMTIEIYPTVVRNIGYGFQNTMTRIGAIVGPQLVFLETMFPGMLYIICTVFGILSILLLKLLPETRGTNLQDKLHEVSKTHGRKHDHTVDKLEQKELNSENNCTEVVL